MSVVRFRPWPPLPRAGSACVIPSAFFAGVFMEMGLGPFLVTTQAQSLIAELLSANGYELIETEYVAARELYRVFIDRPDSRRRRIESPSRTARRFPTWCRMRLSRWRSPEHLEVSSRALTAHRRPRAFRAICRRNHKAHHRTCPTDFLENSRASCGFEHDHVVLAGMAPLTEFHLRKRRACSRCAAVPVGENHESRNPRSCRCAGTRKSVPKEIIFQALEQAL